MEKRIEELALILKKGSKIHIKKENRGKFTDYCGGKVTSECISRGKNSSDPKIRKRATFAANARKWKHADGGIVDSYQPSQTIVDYIKSTEGFKPNWYRDGNGIWTIGYGFTGEEARRLFKNGITRKQADEYFRKMLSERIPMLKNSTPNWEDLNQNQKDSLLSYYYNIGHGGYTRKSPALQRALKERNYKEVAKQMDFGINDKKNPGLQKRRLYEQNLFLTPINLNEKLEENNFSTNPNWTPQGSWLPYSDVKKPIWTSSFTGFHKQGGKIRAYATGNSLVYNPLGVIQDQSEGYSYSGLTYKPFVGIQPTDDSMHDFIYDGFQPSFTIEAVNVPAASDKKDDKQSESSVVVEYSPPTSTTQETTSAGTTTTAETTTAPVVTVSKETSATTVKEAIDDIAKAIAEDTDDEDIETVVEDVINDVANSVIQEKVKANKQSSTGVVTKPSIQESKAKETSKRRSWQDISIKNIHWPEISLPDIDWPDIDLPDVSRIKDIDWPDIKIPRIKLPKIKLPKVKKPIRKRIPSPEQTTVPENEQITSPADAVRVEIPEPDLIGPPKPVDLVQQPPIEEQPVQKQPQKPTTPIKPSVPSKTAPADATKVVVPKVPKGQIMYKTQNMDVGNMGEFIEVAKRNGISFMVTSGHRPGAKTSSGRPSHHGAGNAIDIVPIPGQTFEDIIEQMRNAPELLAWMRAHKIGMLDERSRAVLAKTKGTGAHFHIGPDNSAIADFKKFFG